MRKILTLIIAIVSLLSMSACSQSDIYTTTKNNLNYDNSSINITSPDGSTYIKKSQGGNSSVFLLSSQWNDDYDNDNSSEPSKSKPFIVIVVFFILGIISITAPDAIWYLKHGRHFKDAEPSDTALILIRISGVIAIIAAIIILLI